MIVIASFPKSGNTWVRLFLGAYYHMRTAEQLMSAGFVPLYEGQAAFEALTFKPFKLDQIQLYWSLYKQLVSSGQTKFFKSHLAWVPMGNEPIFPSDTRAVHLVRDPRSVCRSWANHAGLSLEDSARQITQPGFRLPHRVRKTDRTLPATVEETIWHPVGSWRFHTESWMSAPIERLQVRYEDLKADPEAGFREILAFSGVDIFEDRLAFALQETAFESLQKAEQKVGFKEASELASEGFFRSGGADDGSKKAVLPREALSLILEDCQPLMDQLDY